MSSHPNYLVGFDLTIPNSAKYIVDKRFTRGMFMNHLSFNIYSQGVFDHASGKLQLSPYLFSSSKGLFFAGSTLQIIDNFVKNPFPIDRYEELIQATGNMTYDSIAYFINEFSSQIKPYLRLKDYETIKPHLDSSSEQLLLAWNKIGKKHTTVITKDK